MNIIRVLTTTFVFVSIDLRHKQSKPTGRERSSHSESSAYSK